MKTIFTFVLISEAAPAGISEPPPSHPELDRQREDLLAPSRVSKRIRAATSEDGRAATQSENPEIDLATLNKVEQHGDAGKKLCF